MPNDNNLKAWLLRFFDTEEMGAALPTTHRKDVALHRLLFLLLPALENQGMTLSPDRYIRLKRLIAALPRDTQPADWRNYLCPLFATDEARQRAFYALFDQILDQLELEINPEPELQEKENRPDTTKSAQTPPPSPLPQPLQSPQPDTPTTHRPLVVELDECTDPPWAWNIVPEKENVPVETGPVFGKTVLQLRRRETAEYALPDMPASVRATIAEGGVPIFRYRYPTRPAEYLLLVERHALDDHRAGLFDFFYQSLRDNEVFIERFFYQGDLRICRNERHPAGLNLQQLRYRYPDARLVVMGAGYRFISPKTGELAPWTQPLYGWRRRVLLTPMSRHEWGQRERALQDIFTLLPASFQSLHYLSGAPDEALHGQYDALPEYIRRIAETQPVEIAEPVLNTLRRHFDPGTLCWIAACAVYPALHFELTLRLGRLLSGSLGYNLVSAANLLALARLPWFTAGQMPAPARTELLEYLERRHPEQHRLVLDYLRQLLEDNPPPDHSVAWVEHQINLALLKAMRDPEPDPDTLHQLRAVVKRLDRPEKRGDFVLPGSWEALLGKFNWEKSETEPIKPKTEQIKPKAQPFKTFIIYAREDTQFREELHSHLRPLENAGRIKVWSDREINPGVEWEKEIVYNLETADIILILVSAAYYNSIYIHEVEIRYALNRYEKGEAMLLPVIVRPCSFLDDPFISRLQVLPTDGKPVNSRQWPDRDDAWSDVMAGIKRAIDSIPEAKTARSQNLNPHLTPVPLKVFVAYAREDIDYKDAIITHVLKPLKKNGLINFFHDGEILAGDDWDETIQKNLEEADIVIPVLSVHFINSKYITNVEMKKAFERHGKEEIKILPIVARGTSWRDDKRLSSLQVLLENHPMDKWPSKGKAADSIYNAVKKTILDWQEEKLNFAASLRRSPAQTLETTLSVNEPMTAGTPKPNRSTKDKTPPGTGNPKQTDIPGSIPFLEMKHIRGKDKFLIGPEHWEDHKKPVVNLRDFEISIHQVTFEQYDAYCESEGIEKPNDNRWGRLRQPVINVNWLDAVRFCNWLSRQNNLPEAYHIVGGEEYAKMKKNARGYRLPSEAEWEYAARDAGKSHFKYAGSDDIHEVTWYQEKEAYRPYPVGGKKPNKIGLYDMSGNVSEWCGDCRAPLWKIPKEGIAQEEGVLRERVVRGGDHTAPLEACECTHRGFRKADSRENYIGFRVARSV